MSTIEIEISPEGTSRVLTQGFTGNSCRAASQFLEDALGAVTQETLTSEFHQTEATRAISHLERP